MLPLTQSLAWFLISIFLSPLCYAGSGSKPHPTPNLPHPVYCSAHHAWSLPGHFPSVCKVNIASLTLSRRAQLPAQGLGPETTCSGHWWDALLPTLPPHTQPVSRLSSQRGKARLNSRDTSVLGSVDLSRRTSAM